MYKINVVKKTVKSIYKVLKYDYIYIEIMKIVI